MCAGNCTLKVYILESAFCPVFKEQDSTVFKLLISLQGDPICLTHRLLLWKPVFSIYRTFRNPFYAILISLIAERQFNDGLSSWGTESAMHQENPCKGTRDLNLWTSSWRSWVKTLIACQEIPLSPFTVRRTQRWGGWPGLAIRKCGQRG